MDIMQMIILSNVLDAIRIAKSAQEEVKKTVLNVKFKTNLYIQILNYVLFNVETIIISNCCQLSSVFNAILLAKHVLLNKKMGVFLVKKPTSITIVSVFSNALAL